MPSLETHLAERLAHADFVFVWDLDSRTIGRGDPYRAYRTIYDGLMYAVTEGRHWIAPGTATSVRLDPMPSVSGWDEAFSGELRTRERTSLGGDAVVVHAEVARRYCDKYRTQVFFALSMYPRTEPAWQDLRKARSQLFCDPARN